VQEITTENIQNNATRPMSVVCAEESEFFVLDKEDYVSSGLDVLQQQESQVRLEFFKYVQQTAKYTHTHTHLTALRPGLPG